MNRKLVLVGMLALAFGLVGGVFIGRYGPHWEVSLAALAQPDEGIGKGNLVIEEAGKGNLEVVRSKLVRMNQLFDEAISKYEKDEIEEEKLRDYISTISELHTDVINALPQVFGHDFSSWYRPLYWLDSWLYHAHSKTFDPFISEESVLKSMRESKKYKDKLEGNLPKKGK